MILVPVSKKKKKLSGLTKLKYGKLYSSLQLVITQNVQLKISNLRA